MNERTNRLLKEWVYMKEFQAKGKIIYDPVAGKAQNPWWVIVECPKDIMDYYHYWLEREEGVKLNKPLFGSHISVVRGEEPAESSKHLWKVCHEEEVEFAYSHEIMNNGEYYWLEIDCMKLNELRETLGLEEKVQFGFHLTIGRVFV